MPRAQQIYIQPHRSRHTRGQLPEERVPCIDISSLAVLRSQQPALLLFLARIVTREQRFEMLIPFVHEIEPTLLYPAVEVARRDLIWIMKHSILRRQNLHGSLLHRNPCPAELRGIGSEMSTIEVRGAGIVLHHERSAPGNEIEKFLVIRNHIFLGVVGANSQDDGVELAQILSVQLLRRNQRHVHTYLLQHGRYVIPRTHDVTDL